MEPRAIGTGEDKAKKQKAAEEKKLEEKQRKEAEKVSAAGKAKEWLKGLQKDISALKRVITIDLEEANENGIDQNFSAGFKTKFNHFLMGLQAFETTLNKISSNKAPGHEFKSEECVQMVKDMRAEVKLFNGMAEKAKQGQS